MTLIRIFLASITKQALSRYHRWPAFVRHKNYLLVALVFVLFVVVCSTVIFLLSQYWSSRILPNTHFSHFTLGGKSSSQAEAIVDRAIEVYSRERLIFSYGELRSELSLSDLGISFDNSATVEDIFSRGQNLSLSGKLSGFFARREIAPQYFIDTDKFSSAIDRTFGRLEVDPTSANVTFDKGGAKKVASKNGTAIDRSKLVSDLKQRLVSFKTGEIIVELTNTEPLVATETAESAYNQAQNLVGKQVTFVFGYDKWAVSGKGLYELLQFYPQGQSSFEFGVIDVGNPLIIRRAAVGNLSHGELALGLNHKKIDELLDSMAQVIDNGARDASLRFEGGRVIEFAGAQDGQSLKRDQAKKLIESKLSETIVGTGDFITVELPVVVTEAKIANDEVNRLGIRELVGTGVSYFAGSIANRVHNIALGASFVNGVLVKPGDVFSFSSIVGPVSAEQGFRQAYVIKSGRTVLDDGGGICQVSTTVFRAALNSGLPIVKRTAHAYRVSYYEQRGFKAGFDATIFSPTVDLQFKNDTGAHILIQTTIDRANSRLQVDVYGTRDGRTVKLSDPVVSNIVPAPAPQYVDDPTIAKGVVKQVDFAAAGATSVFTRKVYRGDQLIIDDTFKSVYRPWQAVFLVGTAG